MRPRADLNAIVSPIELIFLVGKYYKTFLYSFLPFLFVSWIVFTTSGRSANVLHVLQTSRELGIKSIAFLGKDGGQALGLADVPLLVRHEDTARIQEGHQFLVHAFMGLLEEALTESGPEL